MHPRDDVENRTLIARAERLYEERLGNARLNVGHALAVFTRALERQAPDEIGEACRALSDLLDELDDGFFL